MKSIHKNILKENNNSINDEEYFQYNGLIILLVTIEMAVIFTLGYLSKNNTTGMIWGKNIFNYVIYIGSMLLGGISYLLLSLFLKIILTKTPQKKMTNLWILRFIYLFSFGAGIFFLFIVSRYDLQQVDGAAMLSRFLRYSINPFVLSIGILFVSYEILYFSHRMNEKRNYHRIVLSVFVSLIGASLAYAPNVFQDRMGEIYHAEAYINSIINVMHHIPYDDVATSIYGHYGLIYYPFVKLLGNNSQAIILTIALFVFITYFFAFYICNKLLKNDVFFSVSVIVVFSFAVTFFKYGQYYQIYPHRILFPVITLALICVEEFENTNRQIMLTIELLIGILAVLFNLESGLISIILIAGHRFFQNISKKNAVPNIICTIIYILVCPLLAWISVNLYNYTVGGSWNGMMTFLFPVGSDIYKIEDLRTGLPCIGTDFFVMILVFFLPLCQNIAIRCIGIRKTVSAKSMVCMAISVAGLGLLIYYVNRTASGNISTSVIPFLILLCVYAEDMATVYLTKFKVWFNNPYKLSQYAFSCICLLLCSYFCIESVIGLGITLHNRKESVRNISSLETSLETFRNNVPVGTPAFGMGMPTLYYYLGWDTQSYTIDFADMNDLSIKRIQENMCGWDSFVSTSVIEGMETFELVNTIRTDDFVCNYYERIKDTMEK